jgi:Flp pilus assembly protein TadD
MAENTCSDSSKVPSSGDIKQMTVPWLFQGIRARSRTGTAVFEYIQGQTAEKVTKKVYFKNGDVTFAASNLDADRLGDQLLAAGKITQAQFDASTELIKKTGKKQGAILVELGFLTPQTLVESVKDQVKKIILSLFAVRMGTYRFDEGPLPAADIIPLQMSTGNLILEGVGALDWKDIRKSLPDPTTIIRPASDPSCLFQDAHLSQDQQTVLSFIDGKRSIEEICGASGIGDFNAMKAVFVLLALQMAEEGKIKTEEEMAFAREAVREAVKPKTAAPAAPAEPSLPELVVTRESILETFTALRDQDHYQVLGVERAATAVQIKKAYFQLAKAYHPDRHFDSAMADMKEKLDAIFDRIHKAYEALSDQATRVEYEQELARRKAESAKKPAGGEFVEKKAEEYVENYAEKVARAQEQFNNGMKDFRSGNYWGAVEALTWAARLDPLKAPYFFYLGICLSNIPRRKHEAEENLQKAIEIDATKSEYHIELSNLYIKAGMKTKALGVLNNALEHVSWQDKIQEAIALAGEGKTAAVIMEQAAAKPGKARVAQKTVDKASAVQADSRFTNGMREFKVGNYGVAVDSLSEAVRLNPTKAEYFYYHGLCLSRIARRQTEAEQSFAKALELDPSKVDHHYELGSFYLRNGQNAKGIGILKNALLRFPTAEKVRSTLKTSGVAVAEAPVGEEEKKGGLFGKIFKK